MKKKDRKKQMVLSFTGFLAGATVFSMMMPQKGFSATENRYLKKRPAFTVEGLLDGSYGRDYETSLSDQFPARDAWIGIKVMAERAQGRKDVNGVYFGKDDYLIEKFDTEEIEAAGGRPGADHAGSHRIPDSERQTAPSGGSL